MCQKFHQILPKIGKDLRMSITLRKWKKGENAKKEKIVANIFFEIKILHFCCCCCFCSCCGYGQKMCCHFALIEDVFFGHVSNSFSTESYFFTSFQEKTLQ